jgi:hypothetical protein
VTQAKLRGMAQERIEDAKILIDGGRWWFGYYVSGYAVECALKACVLAQMVGTGWVFTEDEKKLRECRTHDFMRLISIAGMHDPLNARLSESAAAGDGFVENWNTVKAWTVESRYEQQIEADAKKLYFAITDETDGVMRWIRNYW